MGGSMNDTATAPFAAVLCGPDLPSSRSSDHENREENTPDLNGAKISPEGDGQFQRSRREVAIRMRRRGRLSS